MTRGDPPETPPPDLCLGEIEVDPNDENNFIIAAGCCVEGEEIVHVTATGCSKAGGDAIQSVTEQPSATVGLGVYGPSETVPRDSMVRVQVDRIVTPGVAADVVALTFTSGGLQNRAVAGAQSFATLKLIVYPDTTTADADSTLLEGAGSAFFGEATLGGLGSLVVREGFSLGDFLVQDNGDGRFTARLVTGLSKLALVPDANLAVVSLVGDPRSTPASPTGTPGSSNPSDLWLGPATPNPAQGETRIRFAIPRAGRVNLAIYDLQGRLVRELVQGQLAAGHHEARWDGYDLTGRQTSSALYVYRLDVDGRTLTGKVFTLR